MEQLTVALPERAYDIVIERGLLQQVGQQCKEVLKPGCRVAVVTDGNVAIQYGSLVQASLTQAGFTAKIFLVPAGERSKSPEVLTWLWEELLGFGLTRSDAAWWATWRALQPPRCCGGWISSRSPPPFWRRWIPQ